MPLDRGSAVQALMLSPWAAASCKQADAKAAGEDPGLFWHLAVHRGSALLQRTTFVLGGCDVLEISWHQGNGLMHVGRLCSTPTPSLHQTHPLAHTHAHTHPTSHPPRAHPRTSRATPYWQANCRSAKREEQSAGRGRLVWNRNSPPTMRLDPARPAGG